LIANLAKNAIQESKWGLPTRKGCRLRQKGLRKSIKRSLHEYGIEHSKDIYT